MRDFPDFGTEPAVFGTDDDFERTPPTCPRAAMKLCPHMSASGQSRTFRSGPPKFVRRAGAENFGGMAQGLRTNVRLADIRQGNRDVRCVPYLCQREFDSGQCLKFNVPLWVGTNRRPRANSDLGLAGGFANNVIAGLCATPQQSV